MNSALVLQQLRAVGLNKSPKLSPVERDLIGESFESCRRSLSRVAWTFYASRVDDVSDAADWLASETYAYVISSVIAGKLAIPGSAREWLAVAKTIRHRYYASREIVVDARRARLIGDDDCVLGTIVSTRIDADRLQLDDVAFMSVLQSYACRGLGREVAPAWVVETITHWVTAPGLSWRDRAAELGISRETVKTREAKCKAAVRAGVLGDVVAIAD